MIMFPGLGRSSVTFLIDVYQSMTWRLFILMKVLEAQKDNNLSLNSCSLSILPINLFWIICGLEP
uniref:Uncharacterized protein n=1 Tax=Arundo donax TaxID=35708 RepID=A0A0A9D3I8_ARUDO